MDTTLSAPIGQLLDGRYLVESQIARGGMATVYLAQDVRLERTVALKIAHPELARDQGFVARFISEARSVARLSSPNVVAVFDQGSTGDLHYIAMEYVPGPTLRELLAARGRLNPREALDIIERVLAGLAAAHEAGIIHRDVKPENVLLGNGTSVKVADFGLARAAAGVSNTRTGMLIGTAAYLAPEQVASNSADQRSDVYAAGVMLFEMLTGVQPHTGESPLAVAYKHVNAIVPAPSSVVADLPPALDALVALATSRDPELRPSDARHYLRAIAEVRRGMRLPAAGRGEAAGSPPGRGGTGNGVSESDRTHAEAAGDALPAVAMLAGHQYEQAAPAGEGGWPQQPENWPSAEGRGGAGATGPIGNGAAANPTSGYPAARAGGHGGTNHTMIVPAGMGGDSGAGAFNGGGFNGTDYGAGAYSGRRQHRHDEPWLQRWLFSRRILILLAVVLVGLGAWWLTEGQYFSVPSVVGMSVATARGDLTNAGLVAVSGTARHSDSVPAGQVISTDPAPGARITHGGKVTLITSLGPVLITVPSVSGQQLAQAEQSLRAAGLRPGQATYQASASIPSGVVISTSPVAYTHWPQNKPVGLIVSEGPPLPGFAGQQLSAAQGAAATGGYSINPVTVAKSDQPAGTILRQSPAAGTPITAGEVVTVWVSPGPPQVAVPNVQGMNVNQAEKALTAAGFQVTVNQIGIGNRVVSYSPTGQAPQGSTITLTVGFGF